MTGTTRTDLTEQMAVTVEPPRSQQPRSIELGLLANWPQFSLLMLINAFVGAMIGLERSVLPLVAATEYGVASMTAALSFIAVFGVTKALTNLAAGALADRRGRRRILLVGWWLAIPVPLIILSAPSWSWIVAANALLGVSQGLTWSTTIIMKIDLAGPARRGLAMGLNEFAGYVAVAVAALASGWAAQQYGLRTGPAYLGVGVAIAGLTLSTLFVRDTTAHVALEESRRASSDNAAKPPLLDVMRRSLWSDRGLFSTSQAGLVNNLNDGLAWGVFPLFFAAAGLDVRTATILVASYPAVWGMTQLVTGPLGDRWGRKPLIVAGMVLQGVALVGLSASRRQGFWIAEMVALGVGTALVYPTLLAAVADVARPSWRGTAVGVYRLWRDLGYVVGALLAGVLVDALGMREAIAAIGMLTIGSGVLFAVRFTERPRAS